MLDLKKLLGKKMLTRALAALLLALVLCVSACDNSGVGADTTAPDLDDPTTQVTTVDDATDAPSDDGSTEEPTEDPTEEPTEQPTDPSTDTTVDGTTTESESETTFEETTTQPAEDGFDLSSVPAYSGNPYYALGGNTPWFTESEKVTSSYETYGELDALGRCTTVMACCGKDLMPTGDRGNISSIKPTGWVQNVYSCVNGGNLYNRCHLIGWQLTGEDANASNLITGTRYFNENMIPFENMIADYIKETGNHVMYRVTPIFKGNNLVADGAVMEAWSVEDDGEGVCFNVYMYNVQPGIYIDYATGENYLEADGGTTEAPTTEATPDDGLLRYVLNKNSKKIHKTTCSSVATISQNNRVDFVGTEEEVEALFGQGYTNCGSCKGTN